MACRKALRPAPGAASTTSYSTSTKNYVSARDYYNRRYKEVDKERRSKGLYEESTELYINRIEGL